ncbi:amidohydrolase family protein [Catalinimonas sp. 4WD22]|uniref:amidohydrolase family protein n=1 Tax=Catalinimonas locisalis TaxID=3133978 RepID=UPI00310100CE
MLVDTNAYVGHWPFRHREYNSCTSLLGRMNQFGVDVSVVSNMNGVFYKNTQTANEELYEELKSKQEFQERFIPFAVINPIYSGWKDDFKVSTQQMGMRGIRMFPKYHGYDLTNPACVELVKMARDRDLPVAFSLRMVDSRPSSWLDLERKTEWALKDVLPIIREVPDAKYMIVNVAGSTALNEEETELIRNANVIMDTSGRGINRIVSLLDTLGKDKLAFGTHSPILDYLTGLLRIESLRPEEADEETKKLLRYGNAKRILGEVI